MESPTMVTPWIRESIVENIASFATVEHDLDLACCMAYGGISQIQ